MATCKDCIHCEACKEVLDAAGFFSDDIEEILSEIKCPNFADKSRFVELPCKPGDTVYYLSGIHKNHIKTAIVEEIIINCNGIHNLVITVENGSTFGMPFSTFFLTREEAEAALKERTNKS